MDGETTTQTYRAEIVVRSLAPHGINERQRAIIEQIKAFHERGVLEDVDIEVWGEEIRADPEMRTDAHDRYAAIESWADGHEYMLSPGFDRRERRSITANGIEEVISFPLICLVLYAVGEGSKTDAVRAVFPCSDDEQTYTIVDGIEALSHRAALNEFRSAETETGDGSTNADSQRPIIETL